MSTVISTEWVAVMVDEDGFVMEDGHIRGWAEAAAADRDFYDTDSEPSRIAIVTGSAGPRPQSDRPGERFFRMPSSWRSRDVFWSVDDLEDEDPGEVVRLWDLAVDAARGMNAGRSPAVAAEVPAEVPAGVPGVRVEFAQASRLVGVAGAGETSDVVLVVVSDAVTGQRRYDFGVLRRSNGRSPWGARVQVYEDAFPAYVELAPFFAALGARGPVSPEDVVGLLRETVGAVAIAVEFDPAG